MTTVGYGDIYPKTTMGRVIGVVVALWGLFLVSIFTVTLTNLFSFSAGEKKAFDLSNRLQLKDSLREAAANVLNTSFRLQRAKRNGYRQEEIKEQNNYYKKKSIQFFQVAKQVENLNNGSKESDQMRGEIKDLFKKIRDIEASQKKIKEHCKNLEYKQRI